MTLEGFAKAVAKHDDSLRWLDDILFGQDMDEARQDAIDTTMTELGGDARNWTDNKVKTQGGDIYADAYVSALKMTLTSYAKAAVGPKATLIKEILENADELEAYDKEWPMPGPMPPGHKP